MAKKPKDAPRPNEVAVADNTAEKQPSEPVTTGVKQVHAINFPMLVSAVVTDKKLTLTCDAETIEAINACFGTFSDAFVSFAVGQLIDVLATGMNQGADGDVTPSLKVALAAVAGIAPRNEMEAMAAIQMVGAHKAACEMTRRSLHTDNLEFKSIYGNLANKFSRTYLAQMDGLARLRRNGEQVVKHVHVNEGGQAVIARTVNTGGRV